MRVGRILIASQLQNGDGSDASVSVLPFHYGTVVEDPKEYLKWIKYVPTDWNISELEKKVYDKLNDNEKRLLDIRRKEKEVAPHFENFSKKATALDVSVVYDYMSKMTIPRYARLKLTSEEFKRAQQRANKHTDEAKSSKDTINILKSIIDKLSKSSKMEDDYVAYILKMRVSDLTNRRVEREIKSQTKNNAAVEYRSMHPELKKKH